MINTRLSFLLLLTTFFVGCSNMPTNSQNKAVFQDQLSTLMLDYASIENLQADELKTVFNSVKEKFLKEEKSDDRIRYILLLVLPEQEFYDRNAALSLLNEWPNIEQQPTSIIAFRSILIKRLAEEKRIHDIVNNLSRQLRHEKQQTDTLQKKINDIKDMEKKLIRRNIQDNINGH